MPDVRERVLASRCKVVVLDDDPTGTQTVYGLPVLTDWSVAALQAELASELTAFYILTNSRSVPLAQAEALNEEIGLNLVKAARANGVQRDFVVVSRSDSTLRGHFPGEVGALAHALNTPFDAWLIIPAFIEGGRFTIDDVHYVAEADWLVPAGQTEFARDVVFGYHTSNLREWIEEKTAGHVRAEQVASISLDEIRQGGPNRVAEHLMTLTGGRMCIVNIASAQDMQVFASGLLQAEATGRHFLYRTAASFVQVRAGLTPRSLLRVEELNLSGGMGGLIVVGSHVPMTVRQVAQLRAARNPICLEADVRRMLDEGVRVNEIRQIAQSADEALQRGDDVLICTSHEVVTGRNPEESLAIAQHISRSLIEIVRVIPSRPRYILAKGGITSSDIATEALGVKRAMVLGQILPGVPVWELGAESRYPGLTYIVFPGNVGGPNAIADIVAQLSRE
ncbi:MAG TPA: four-carbon acid sugar kinase family protein [Anaerolineae bacterium]|nr:four-carbon acid sugar kinase family protein [Anaerolineae bacterium]